MTEPWFLATSHRKKTATAIVKLYGRRFTIEETFRDQKDLRFGLGPTMRDEWFDRLMAAYVDILQEHRDMFEIVGAIEEMLQLTYHTTDRR